MSNSGLNNKTRANCLREQGYVEGRVRGRAVLLTAIFVILAFVFLATTGCNEPKTNGAEEATDEDSLKHIMCVSSWPILIDREGNVIKHLKGYSHPGPFSDGVARIRKYDGENYECCLVKRDGTIIHTGIMNMDISTFENGYATCGGMIVRNDGSIAAKTNYDIETEFNDGLAYFYDAEHDDGGFLDYKGNIVIRGVEMMKPPFEKEATKIRFRNGIAIKDVSYIIDTMGNVVREAEKGIIFNSHNERMIVYRDLKTLLFGAIDVDNNITYPAKYEEMHPYRDGLAGVVENGKSKFINRKGEDIIILPDECKIYGQFYCGYAVVKNKHGYNYIDKQGRLLLKNDVSEAMRYTNGVAFVKMRFAKCYSLVNVEGEVVISYIGSSLPDNHAMDIIENDGMIDQQNYFPLFNEDRSFVCVSRVTLDVVKRGFSSFSELRKMTGNMDPGLELVEQCFGERYGYVNQIGDVIIGADFTDTTPFVCGYAAVRDAASDKCGIIDTKGRWKVRPVYDGWDIFPSRYAVVFYKMEEERKIYYHVSVKDWNAQRLDFVPDGYVYDGPIATDEIGVYKDINSREVLRVACTYAASFLEGIAVVGHEKGDGRYYSCIDIKGNIIGERQYADIINCSDGIIVFNRDDQYGAMDKKGNVLFKNRYKVIGKYRNCCAIAINSDGFAGVIDKSGVILFEFERGLELRNE